MFLMLVAVALLGTGLWAFKSRHQGAAAQGAFQPPPESVTTTVARQETWPSTESSVGTVTAVQGVTVSADLPGVIEKISFESGRRVRAGEVLVKLDTRQEEAQLAAAAAAGNLARLSFERMKGLRESGVVPQADFDRAAAELQQGDAKIGEIRATIARKTIRAPFSGLLGIRQVNLGQYLAPGTPIVALQSLDPVYVNFSVPQQQVGRLRPGATVRATAEGHEVTGKVTAVDSVVDEATRNVQIQATFANPDGGLRPGMFVKARTSVGESRPVLVLPASAISYAPYGDSVFIVEEMKGPDGKPYRGARQQFVKLGGARGDLVAVTSGLKPGEEVVTAGTFKLRNGAAVQVNNKIQPADSLSPKPEDS